MKYEIVLENSVPKQILSISSKKIWKNEILSKTEYYCFLNLITIYD